MSQSTSTSYASYSDSPPSSPNFGCIDSSPPSSPGSEFVDFDDKFKEPYAGSQKLVHKIRSYDLETREDSRLKRRKIYIESDGDNNSLSSDIDMEAGWSETARDDSMREEIIWEDATSRVLEEAFGRVDLSGRNLTKISTQAMVNLQYFYVPSIREERDHANMPPPSGERVFTRTSSQVVGVPREKVQLFLATNRIKDIPTELFDVEKLAVLSLAHNRIEIIPPEIGRLKNLQVLNVASNKLQFLPAELTYLTLQNLTLTNNPFISIPQDGNVQLTRLATSAVPRLLELCMRHLVKEAILPNPESAVPVHLMHALRNCLRVAYHCPLSDDGYGSLTGMGTCPCGQEFLLHAEEALTWETKVAGCDLGVHVPLKWRACSIGCLDDQVARARGTQLAPSDDFDAIFQPVVLGGLEEAFDDDE